MKLLIIGAGPGGYETAVEAAKRGIETVIISDGPVGGTCLNEGCIPTKTFCHYAELKEQLAAASDVFGEVPAFDFQAVRARKQGVVERLRSGVETLLAGKLITLVRGRAQFVDSRTVRVGDETFSGDAVIIATGSVPAFLPIPGAHGAGVVISTEILDVQEVPRRLCVIGGGVIGLEFASIFRSFGSEVTVLEYCRELLPRFDSDLSKRLKQALGKRGIAIETSAQVTEVSDGPVVHYTKKDSEFTVEADMVLMAVGRRAALDSLNLQDIGIVCSRRGIEVDENMQTSVPGVYAVGDIVGQTMLAHVASAQGLRALNHICGVQDDIAFNAVPAAVFTIPEAATVGMTEDECEEKGLKVKCLKSFYRSNGKAVSMDASEGWCKIVTDAESGRILGCHILGAHSADLVQEMTAAVALGRTVAEERSLIHAHPTLSEVLAAALGA